MACLFFCFLNAGTPAGTVIDVLSLWSINSNTRALMNSDFDFYFTPVLASASLLLNAAGLPKKNNPSQICSLSPTAYDRKSTVVLNISAAIRTCFILRII